LTSRHHGFSVTVMESVCRPKCAVGEVAAAVCQIALEVGLLNLLAYEPVLCRLLRSLVFARR
jgi:hypothetical protein